MKNVGRKFWHTLGGLVLLGIYYLFGRKGALPVYGLLLAVTLLFDAARLRIPAFNEWTQAKMGTLLRPGEASTLSGSPAYLVGVALTLYLFDLPVATAAVLFLVFGDVCATIVGEGWGKTPLHGKSLEGTTAFVAAGFSAGLLLGLLDRGVPLPILAGGVLTAAAVELFTPPWLNDNLSIPLTSAAVMTLLGMLLS